jgi:hypothetical protein
MNRTKGPMVRSPKGRKGGKPPNKKFKRKQNFHRAPSASVDIESTGEEALYLKSLVEGETPVVVVLRSGEEIRGWVRYYDREVFSLGPADGGPKLFLRKESVRYLYEDPSPARPS